MVSIGRRVSIKAFEVGCNVPTIEVPCKPEHGEFGTPVAKRPIKAIFEFLDEAFKKGYISRGDLPIYYISRFDPDKLTKEALKDLSQKDVDRIKTNEKNRYMNQVEKPIAAVKTQIMEG